LEEVVRDAVIIAGKRTPIGRANKGSLVDVDEFAMAEVAVNATIAASGVPASEIDDIVLAEALHGGGVIARNVAVRLGLCSIPAMSANRHCAAGLAAVQIAAGSIRAGMDRMVVAGGTESFSGRPKIFRSTPASAREYVEWIPHSHPDRPDAPAGDMSITVGENTAAIAGITREESDAWAFRSHARAVASIRAGHFEDEIVPVPFTDADGEHRIFTQDENPRPDTTLERLAALPVLHPELENPTVTAGNASGRNDAAAALSICSDDFASAHGIAPIARIISWASVGVDPARTGLAPQLVIPKALERAGMTTSDVDLFEINEAFCSVAVAATRALDLDPDTVNVNGSGCSLGHPTAVTGARMLITMIHELKRRSAQVGCVGMCAGGGMGSALVFEIL
jgi:acetyl-CoA acetyltransferase family protein